MMPLLGGRRDDPPTATRRLIGFFNGFRMMRLPDPEPSGSVKGMSFGRRWLPIEQRSTGVG